MENFQKIAVLIDADNTQLSKLEAVLHEVSTYGRIVVKKAYGNWRKDSLKNWEPELKRLAIRAEQQFDYVTGKNTTDIAMVIGAMDLLHTNMYDALVLVSSDSDYTRLASRIRESGREVLGFGEKKTPKPFIKSCDKFIYVEILGQPAPAPAPVSAPAQTAAAVPAAKAATPKKTAKKHQGRNAPETDMPEAAPAEPAAAEKKVAPAPDTAQPQPIIRPIDDDFKTLLANTIEDAADDSGWAFLGIVGGVLTKKMPDFDPRNYGYKKLSLLVKSLSKIVEIEERPSENKELKLVYVRNRIR